jgi:uncharacterized protein involved in type VI secretion and phage assembly
MMSGVAIAIVQDLEDPLGEGRIGLRYPWLEDNATSGWAPMASPLAGKNRGMMFLPEPNDEVLVAFDQGDFEHPYILGFLWNGVDNPPDSNRHHRIFKTPGGLQLRFEDDNQKIELSTPGGLSIVMDDSQSSITVQGGGRQVTMQGGSVQIT